MKNEDLAHEMSIQEMTYRFPELTKKEIQEAGANYAMKLIDSGEFDELKALVSAERLKEFVQSFVKEIRSRAVVPEKDYKAFGCTFSVSNTGDRYDWSKDEVYADLEGKLKERQDLLKLALKSKSAIYDSEGIEVPKVPVKTYGSDVIKLKF